MAMKSIFNTEKLEELVSKLCEAKMEASDYPIINMALSVDTLFRITSLRIKIADDVCFNMYLDICVDELKFVRIVMNEIVFETSDPHIIAYASEASKFYETYVFNSISDQIRYVKTSQPQPVLDTDTVRGYPC